MGHNRTIMSQYNLDEMYEKAKTDSIIYGPSVERDTVNYGYSREDVCDCLCSLTKNDFKETKKYNEDDGTTLLLDVYLITFSTPSNVNYDLYIKFRLKGWIYLQSFHP